ncbi:MAG TPA: 4a-hydroxytetrahydrobiopterin dehydratase [Clostridia bacterium]|nr:4a-hydroxytetrahydrobiopterin dehydratase [Clostridia bacterium]
MPTPLPDNDIQQALSGLPHWTRAGDSIQRKFEFPDFRGAMAFVTKVADIAESINHHPDINISYNHVTLSLTSHDSGGITNRDLKLAAQIDDVLDSR